MPEDQDTPEGRLKYVLDQYRKVPQALKPADAEVGPALKPLIADVLGLDDIKVTVRKPGPTEKDVWISSAPAFVPYGQGPSVATPVSHAPEPSPEERAQRATEMQAQWATMSSTRRAFMAILWQAEDDAIADGRAPEWHRGWRPDNWLDWLSP